MPGMIRGLSSTLWVQSASSSGEPMSQGSRPSGKGSVDSGRSLAGKRTRWGMARSR